MALRALVWKRTDFRESSRVVTLWTRERGRIRVLAKGAHRPTSALLGKIDFLNRLDVDLSGRGMPILGRTRLVHEPRGLRTPERFSTALYLVGLFELTLLDDRADVELYDLCEGALTLVELAPLERLKHIVAGIELRLLANLGQLPAPTTCSQCGTALFDDPAPTWGPAQGGVFCSAHPPHGAVRLSRAAMSRLSELIQTPGRLWPTLLPNDRADHEVIAILARWVAFAIGDLPRSRGFALRALARSAG